MPFTHEISRRNSPTQGLELDIDFLKGAGGSFLDLGESDDESTKPKPQKIVNPPIDENSPEKPMGATFDELVDRLLALPMSKADAYYNETFLCLYRKFASPGQLLSAILLRLEQAADDKNQHFLRRTNTQLRIVGVLTKWIVTYPGDFAGPATREHITSFVEQIAMEPAFSYAALEIKIALRTTVLDDDDTRWECCDTDLEPEAEVQVPSEKPTPASSVRSAMQSQTTSKSSLVDSNKSPRQSEAKSELSSISVDPSLISSGRPSGIHTVQEYEMEAATMRLTKRQTLMKPRWLQVLDIPDDDWADEITRIDWIMFSSVRVRDLLRDVNTSGKQKARFRNLVNVNRAINHFNHLAAWVSNLVLFREKPKHRALMLEKFMRIAWKLRQLNNYNGLAAVLAGLQNSAVSRLIQTQALISADDRKNYMRLEILMGPRRSHFAYRLAWQNSPLPRIPYIPLSRRDLSAAEDGSKTILDNGRINWRKMEVFGAVILPIIASSGSSYEMRGNRIARELILDTAVQGDDERLYERSLVLEASGQGERTLKQRLKMW